MPRNRMAVDRRLSRRPRRVGPLIDNLEERLLFSLTSIVDASLAADVVAVEASPPQVHHAPLSSGENGGSVLEQAPEALGFDPVILGEDANDYYIDLSAAFQDPSGGTLRFELLDNHRPDLFEGAIIEGDQLKLDLARHAFGQADMTVRAIGDGGSTDTPLSVFILPMNDRPTTHGFQDVALDETQTRMVIDLFAAFDDIEDPDHHLTFTVTGNTHPELFESVTIDSDDGQLILLAARGVSGTSSLTIRATDTEGAYVEMSTKRTNFPIYDEIRPDQQGHTTLGLQEMNFAHHGVLYDRVNGIFDFTQINETKFRDYLRSPQFNPSLPTVIDIENNAAGNHPAGRKIRAQVMRILWEEHPDAELAGFYGFMPNRSWWAPVPWRQAQEDLARGLLTWYTVNSGTLQQDYSQWQANNALLRTAPLQDGSVLPDHVSAVYPSLYTFYRFGYVTSASPLVVDVTFDGTKDLFSVADGLLADGTEVGFNPTNTAGLPHGFRTYTSYYVVNSDGQRFQLAAERGGEPIPLAAGAHGKHFLEIIGPRDYLPHDPEFLHWRFYAEENIAEARKYNLPVIPWISASMLGVGSDYMDENFFRYQLDTLFELADGITIWDHLYAAADLPQNQGWFRALADFVSYIRTPTEFQVTVDTSTLSDGDTMLGRTIHRLDRFTEFAFAAGTRGHVDTGGSQSAGSRPTGGDGSTTAFPMANSVVTDHLVVVDGALGGDSNQDVDHHFAPLDASFSMSYRIQQFQSQVESPPFPLDHGSGEKPEPKTIDLLEVLAKLPETSDPGEDAAIARFWAADSVTAISRQASGHLDASRDAASHATVGSDTWSDNESTIQLPFFPLDPESRGSDTMSALWRLRWKPA